MQCVSNNRMNLIYRNGVDTLHFARRANGVDVHIGEYGVVHLNKNRCRTVLQWLEMAEQELE